MQEEEIIEEMEKEMEKENEIVRKILALSWEWEKENRPVRSTRLYTQEQKKDLATAMRPSLVSLIQNICRIEIQESSSDNLSPDERGTRVQTCSYRHYCLDGERVGMVEDVERYILQAFCIGDLSMSHSWDFDSPLLKLHIKIIDLLREGADGYVYLVESIGEDSLYSRLRPIHQGEFENFFKEVKNKIKNG